MKIKLHNSLSKMDESRNECYLFDEKIFIRSLGGHLHFPYRINEGDYFIKFSLDTKEFEKHRGFGGNDKHPNSKWWKNPYYNWEEMSE